MHRTNSDTPLSRRDFVGTAATIAAAAAIPGQHASGQRPTAPREPQLFAIEEQSIADLSKGVVAPAVNGAGLRTRTRGRTHRCNHAARVELAE